MRSRLKAILERKLVNPLLDFLKQGITPERLALCISLGAVLGLFPVIGLTTILCAIVALVFRLNMAIIQLINYFVYPLQLLVIIPIIRFGSSIFGVNPVPYSIGELLDLVSNDVMQAVKSLWLATLFGIAGWLILAVPVALLIYVVTKKVFLRIESKS